MTSSTLDAGIPARLIAATQSQSSVTEGGGGTFYGVDTEIDGCQGGQGALKSADGSTCDGSNVDFFNHDEDDFLAGTKQGG